MKHCDELKVNTYCKKYFICGYENLLYKKYINYYILSNLRENFKNVRNQHLNRNLQGLILPCKFLIPYLKFYAYPHASRSALFMWFKILSGLSEAGKKAIMPLSVVTWPITILYFYKKYAVNAQFFSSLITNTWASTKCLPEFHKLSDKKRKKNVFQVLIFWIIFLITFEQ